MLTVAKKQPDNFDEILKAKAWAKLPEEEMFIKTLFTTLFQMFCKIIVDSYVIMESIVQ